MIYGIPGSIQDSDLKSTLTSILSNTNVNSESREVEHCHRTGKSNNGSKKTIIRFINRALDNFKSKQKKCMKYFLICKSKHFLKVHSTHYTLK